jgi:putative membrane protein
MLTVPLALATDASAALQLLALALLALLYARRAQTLTAGGRPPERWRQGCFYGGLLVSGAAVLALAAPSRELLLVRTSELLLLGDLAALALVLGLSEPMLAPVLRVRAFARLRVLCHPAVAYPLWAINLYVWHLSSCYEAALRHSGVDILQHAMFLGLGVNMWMCLLGPLPVPSWFGDVGKLTYTVAVRLTGAVLSNIFLWSGTVFYPYYLAGEEHLHVSPLADQNIAGALMVADNAVLLLCVFAWLFLRAAPPGGEHHGALEFAPATATASARARELTEAGSGASEHGWR